MGFRFLQAFLIGLLVVILAMAPAWPGAAPASARTLCVERDGSGNFTEIQPAIDAAASGDTILIGPGEYLETFEHYLP
ncbi:MAG: hypothetical protein ABIK96_16485, partial [bacterium]